ncbi:MAG: di-heme oxidoredictase family protein [Gemmatimonadota bacterium]
MKPKRPSLLLFVACIASFAGGCDALITEAPLDADVLDAPLPGLTPGEMAVFIAGDEEFGRAFAPADGLGPLFTNVSCAACHSGDGRGRPEPRFSNLVPRVDPTVATAAGHPFDAPVIQVKALPGADPEVVPEGIPVSLRLPPPVFGVGLIEAIPAAQILSRADPDDADEDGISGRPHWVTPPEWMPRHELPVGPGPYLGRFTRKGRASTIFEQVVDAYLNDMGITTDFLYAENRNVAAGAPTKAVDRVPDPELPTEVVTRVAFYLRLLAPPAPGQMNPVRELGQELFGRVGCASCHTPKMTTGPHAVAALAHQPVPLYSDLLLHDMGPELADDVQDIDATGTEWRTAPLWGLRVAREFLDGELFLMHDGRARGIEEAVLFHGGEGNAARAAFMALPAADRRALVDFVGSR